VEVVVAQLVELPAEAFAPLVAESEREGWRFDQPGEAIPSCRLRKGGTAILLKCLAASRSASQTSSLNWTSNAGG
jgi:hypothetical protein